MMLQVKEKESLILDLDIDSNILILSVKKPSILDGFFMLDLIIS